MSFNRLIAFADLGLSINRSVVVDAAEFERLTGQKITRETANRAAWTIVNQRRRYYAAAEAFLNSQTREEIRVYLICARTREAYTERAMELQRDVAAELRADIKHVLYPHDHRDREEKQGPIPLKEPPKDGC